MALRHLVLIAAAFGALLTVDMSSAEPPLVRKPPVVVDANGKQIGPVIGMNEYLDAAYVLIRVADIEFPAAVSTYDFIAPTGNRALNLGTIYYESRYCTGQPYVDVPDPRVSGSWVAIDRGIAYAPIAGAEPQTILILGQRPQFSPSAPYYCDPVSKTRTVVPAFELIDLNVAFVPPFRIEIR